MQESGFRSGWSLRLNGRTQRSVAARFSGENIVGLTWPKPQSHTGVLELTD